jgi:glyoxylase-like metal-dependent hydrolase (beta-lactamase superfamily II)
MPDITHDTATPVSARVRRITAPNPGRMTGPGTNTYIVGEHELAVIDPGPPIDSHIDALVDICAGRLKWILVTHTHRDHSPGAVPLAERTGAELIGNIIPNDGFQDVSFNTARPLAQDDTVGNDEFTIRALLTPGHVANHVCYLVEEDRLLVTGDHMMGGSTVVIVPPAGSMKDYIESLERMLNYDVEFVAPGHGDLIAQPADEVRRLIAHRLKREDKVAEALKQLAPSSVKGLVPTVYDDVDPAMHEWAALSLHAHLLKLEAEGRAVVADELWSLQA